MRKELVLAYAFSTVAYIFLIGYLMVNLSAWWFLALFLWHWEWRKEWMLKHKDEKRII